MLWTSCWTAAGTRRREYIYLDLNLFNFNCALFRFNYSHSTRRIQHGGTRCGVRIEGPDEPRHGGWVMEPYRGTNRCAGQAAGLQPEHDGVSNIYLDLNLFNFDSHLAFHFDSIIRI